MVLIGVMCEVLVICIIYEFIIQQPKQTYNENLVCLLLILQKVDN